MRLPQDIQELSLSCLCYLSLMDSSLIQSLAACCFCENLDSVFLVWIIEVLHSAYKARNTATGSFLVTLLSRFKISPGTQIAFGQHLCIFEGACYSGLQTVERLHVSRASSN